MTPRESVEKHRHEACGIIADAAASHRTGGELALFLRSAFTRLDKIMLEAIEDVVGPPQQSQNGKPAAPAAQTQVKR